MSHDRQGKSRARTGLCPFFGGKVEVWKTSFLPSSPLSFREDLLSATCYPAYAAGAEQAAKALRVSIHPNV